MPLSVSAGSEKELAQKDVIKLASVAKKLVKTAFCAFPKHAQVIFLQMEVKPK
jgi:hypothetical protein